MIVSISSYSTLAKDNNGNLMPIGGERLGREVRTSAGNFAAIPAGAKFIRVATDTAIHIDVQGDAVTAGDEFVPANSTEFFSCNGGEVFKIAAA